MTVVLPHDTTPRPEREATDESLESERRNADRRILERLAVGEASADEGLEQAREQADATLDIERSRADAGRLAEMTDPRRSGVAGERRLHDDLLRTERAAVDDVQQREREERTEMLASLMARERDLTDRSLVDEREYSDQAVANRDTFLGMVSHDLRNLLNSVSLQAKLLSAQASDSEEGRRTVAGATRIEAGVARMGRLVSDLVDLVSIDAGKLSIERRLGDLRGLVTEVVGAFVPTAAAKGVALVAEPGAAVLDADLDHDRMAQVLVNLISNALRFTPTGGSVTVSSERAGDELRLTVRDTGRGVAAEHHEAVFERFWQAAGEHRSGLGLGLYISRRIVEAHGGRIWVDSAQGGGCAFQLTLPAAS